MASLRPDVPGDEHPAGSDPEQILATNLAVVRGAIDRAALRSGRDPQAVRLVAVTKSVGADTILRLASLGMRDLGENRLQVAAPKIEHVEATETGLDWHLIGHLQSNKARRAVQWFSWIHAVDSVPLMLRLDRVAKELGKAPRLLLQVNVAREASKQGLGEEQLAAALEACAGLEAARPSGLMTIAPLVQDPEESRPVFRRLAGLLEDARSRGVVDDSFRHLSMGMTNDFEVAVEEGATLVRVGTALFRGVEAVAGPAAGHSGGRQDQLPDEPGQPASD